VYTWGGLAAAAGEGPHFVIDIHDTLIYARRGYSEADARSLPGEYIQEVDGKYYRLSDGAGEFLAALASFPGAKVSIFSNSPPDYIRGVLRKIKLPDGTTALDCVNRTGGQLLSDQEIRNIRKKEYEHLEPDMATFSSRDEKKDLSLASPPERMGWTFLFDDDAGYVAAGQEKNLVKIHTYTKDRLTRTKEWKEDAGAVAEDLGSFFEEIVPLAEAEGGGGFAGKNFWHFTRDRNKLVYALGLVSEALRIAEAEGIPPAEALWRLQWMPPEKGARFVYRREELDFTLYRAGLRRIRAENRRYRLARVAASPECKRHYLELRDR
jgi:hypothetical protein